jgi:hypothetical protein
MFDPHKGSRLIYVKDMMIIHAQFGSIKFLVPEIKLLLISSRKILHERYVCSGGHLAHIFASKTEILTRFNVTLDSMGK